MKRILTLLAFYLIFWNFVHAQIPPKAFNYSGVAWDVNSNPIANTIIGVQINIRQSTASGPIVFSENHLVNTDQFGLFNLIIGTGAVQSGAMNSINWSADDYYLQTGLDATGGTNFLTVGTTQFRSVPYAFYAETADSIAGGTGFTHYVGESFGGGIVFKNAF